MNIKPSPLPNKEVELVISLYSKGEYSKAINSIKKLLGDTIEMVKEKAPKVYRKELIELLFEQPYSKIDYVIEKIGVERKAASRYLKELESIGVLKSIQMGRQVIYVNEDLIEILRRN